MQQSKTVKSFLNSAIIMANTPIVNLKGINKLTDKEQRKIGELTVILQNDLGELEDLLRKYKLKYP